VTSPAPIPPPPEATKRGIVATIGLLFGVVTLAVAAIGALNTAFDLNLALGSYGASAPLPNNWDVVFGVAAVGVLILALTFFGSAVARVFRNAKGKPLVRIAIVLGTLVLLVLAGRGLQVMALTSTYGSMLAYYCTDAGSLEDVEGELANGPTPEALDRCLSRTAQWGRTDLLEHVIKAGGNFKDESSEPKYRSCVLGGQRVDADYVDKAIALGARPDNCPKSETLIYRRVERSRDDADTARIVAALAKAGWSTEVHPDHVKQSPLALAKKKKLEKTSAALVAAAKRR
jgi:hypothetical protein